MRNPVAGIRNPQRGIQNPRLSCMTRSPSGLPYVGRQIEYEDEFLNQISVLKFRGSCLFMSGSRKAYLTKLGKILELCCFPL